MTISVHLDDIRRADVSHDGTGARVTLRVGAFNRVCLLVKTEAQARLLAAAINASIDPDAPLYPTKPEAV